MVSHLFVYTPSQLRALSAFKANKSFLLTGSAGTGKSKLIQDFKSLCSGTNGNESDSCDGEGLNSEGTTKKIAVCATTGLAAVQIGGRTIDSFMRLFPQDASASMDSLIVAKMKNRAWVNTLKDLDCLLIDEASMLTPQKFLQCDALLKAVRGNKKPFGGLQTILIGDFFQLPPISNSSLSQQATFIFELDEFYELMDDAIDLEEVHRQKDPEFVALLRRMRVGNLNESDKDVLKSRVGASLKDDGIKATSLFAQNVDVDRLNAIEQEKLKTRKNVFTMRNGCKKSAASRGKGTQQFDVQNLQRLQESLIKEVGLPLSLELRIGAQVMLVHNLDVEGGLVNGSRGVVIGFAKTSRDNPDREYDPEPLGSTKKDGPDRNLYYPDEPLPIVKFAVSAFSSKPTGPTTSTSNRGEPKQRAIEIPYVRWEKVEKKLGEAWVTALPLKLAWSSTIHKCQGSSLDRVEASIDKTVFAYGQAYVAISRVTTLDGLTLKSFDPSVVRAHPAVLEFHTSSFHDLKAKRAVISNVSAGQSRSRAEPKEESKVIRNRKRSRSDSLYDSETAFAPMVMNAEQVMASEARMLEIFAQQRLQDEDDDDDL